MKKLLSMALVASMAISALVTTAFAANGNVSLRVDDNKTEVAPGEQIVVRIDSAAKAISTDGFNVKFDTEKFTCDSVTNSKGKRAFNVSYYDEDEEDYVNQKYSVASTADEANEGGVVAFGFAGTESVEYSEAKDFAILTFTAKKGASGTTEFVLNENSAGTNRYVGVVETYTVEIKSEDPGYEVIDPVITGITISPEVASVKGGETVEFTAVVEGTDGQDAEGNVVAYDKTVTWSDNAPDGVFTAPDAKEEAQTFTVTATAADGKVATATVKVYGETPVVTLTGVEVSDAKATQADSYKARNTMYWGVKITNGMKGAVEAWMNDGEADSKTTTLDFSNVTINGDAEFGIFTMVTADRLDKAITLNVKDVASGVVGSSVAATYSELN